MDADPRAGITHQRKAFHITFLQLVNARTHVKIDHPLTLC